MPAIGQLWLLRGEIVKVVSIEGGFLIVEGVSDHQRRTWSFKSFLENATPQKVCKVHRNLKIGQEYVYQRKIVELTEIKEGRVTYQHGSAIVSGDLISGFMAGCLPIHIGDIYEYYGDKFVYKGSFKGPIKYRFDYYFSGQTMWVTDMGGMIRSSVGPKDHTKVKVGEIYTAEGARYKILAVGNKECFVMNMETLVEITIPLSHKMFTKETPPKIGDIYTYEGRCKCKVLFVGEKSVLLKNLKNNEEFSEELAELKDWVKA